VQSESPNPTSSPISSDPSLAGILEAISLAMLGVFLATVVVRAWPLKILDSQWQLGFAAELINSASLALVGALLIPLALAGAVQPLLVGQAISVLRQEASLPWLAALPVPVALRLLVGLLLVAVLLRLALQGTQSFNVQVVGQRLTARIRADLFRHALGLSLRFHDRTPVGKLLTRLTSDVDALAEVFGSGAVGVLADLVSLLVAAQYSRPAAAGGAVAVPISERC
jgi:ABC-type multidrug transport system fused ATPase/permease subunit